MDFIRPSVPQKEAECMNILSSQPYDTKELQQGEKLCKDLHEQKVVNVNTDEHERRQDCERRSVVATSAVCHDKRENKAWCLHACTGRRGILHMERFSEEEEDLSTIEERQDSQNDYTTSRYGECMHQPKRIEQDRCATSTLGAQGTCSCAATIPAREKQEEDTDDAGSFISLQGCMSSEDGHKLMHEIPEWAIEEEAQSIEPLREVQKNEAIVFDVIDVSRKRFKSSLESLSEAEEKIAPPAPFANSSIWDCEISVALVRKRTKESEALGSLLATTAPLEYIPDLSAYKVWKVYSRKNRRDLDGTRSLGHACHVTTSGSSDVSAVCIQEVPKVICSREEGSVTSCNVQNKPAMVDEIKFSCRGNDYRRCNVGGRDQEVTLLSKLSVSGLKSYWFRGSKEELGLMPSTLSKDGQLLEALQPRTFKSSLSSENLIDGVFSTGVKDNMLKDLENSSVKKYWLRGDKELSETISSSSVACVAELGDRTKRKNRCLLGPVEKNMSSIKFCLRKRHEGKLTQVQRSIIDMRRQDCSDTAERITEKIEEDGASAKDERHADAIRTGRHDVHASRAKGSMHRPPESCLRDATNIVKTSEQVEVESNRVTASLNILKCWTGSDSPKRRRILEKGLLTKRKGVLDGVYLQTRSSTFSRKRKGDGQVLRTGPVLRSRKDGLQNSASILSERMQRRGNSGRMLKKSFISRGAKNMVVRALLDKYLRNRATKFGGTGNRLLNDCYLPFLNRGARRTVECFCCTKPLFSGEGILCTYKECRRAYHRLCVQGVRECSWRKGGGFICPQHVCMACRTSRRTRVLRCERCPMAAHFVCLPFPDHVFLFPDKPGRMICWRHSENWRLENKHKKQTSDTQEIFCRLPLPYVEDDFCVSSDLKEEVTGNDSEPAPYIHIRRNVFLIKKKRDDADDGVGCTCNSVCGEDCECRVQSMSCSKTCKCKVHCSNKPFRKDKRIKLVKTQMCGWGAESLEAIKKGEFVIEYIGEVINEAICEDRLWTMKGRGVHNFYMCEIEKDFIIDATFKGNPSRFLNHSCDPNCKLEKWRVDGETRVGVFALRDIMVGEPLTYDYRYIQFGANVRCCCGALNCRRDLGEPFANQKVKTSGSDALVWGVKQKRSYRKDWQSVCI